MQWTIQAYKPGNQIDNNSGSKQIDQNWMYPKKEKKLIRHFKAMNFSKSMTK